MNDVHSSICGPINYRSLTPAMMTWVAKSDRFVFHKDTSLNIELMIEKIKAIQAVPNTKLK